MTTEHSTACILCSINCGIVVGVEDDGRISSVRGDASHPVSRGYLCQKAARLDAYQNHADRLDAPMRRLPDGTFERSTWDEAIADIAARLVAIRDEHGGRALAYYGGGGQGNHLGGVYGSALRAAMQTRYVYSALAQEKTGDFWVNGRLFGRQTCHITTDDAENADLLLLIGTNPWQAHGIPRARRVLREIADDPERTMIVIDPRRTETARMADVHLDVRPGTDAFLLAAIAAVLVEEDLVDRAFLEKRTLGFDAVAAALRDVPIDRYARAAGQDPERVRDVARRLAAARSATVRADLGLQQSLHSTLNSWLEKLLFLLTGNLGKSGANAFHSFLVPLIGHSASPGGSEPSQAGRDEKVWKTTVTGVAEIGKLFPPNVLPAEVNTEHEGRLRGLVVDSANPAVSAADTRAWSTALHRLELLVVIDVAMTETARHADWVLPAPSQLEKWEATFFTLGFPDNAFHLRRPVLPPRPGTLPEPEIYRRLLVAMGELPDSFPILTAAAKVDRRAPRLGVFEKALGAALAARPRWRAYAAIILHETLGAALPDGARAAAVLWASAHHYAGKHADAVRRAGVEDQGAGLGEALFERILAGRAGVILSRHLQEDTWSFIRHPDGRVHLDVDEMLDEVRALARELDAAPGDEVVADPDWPFWLIAGDRRTWNANTIYRDPRWRKSDHEGALAIHPDDAAALGVADGDPVECESAAGKVVVPAHLTDAQRRGVVSLPHGYGLEHPDAAGSGARVATGPQINELTSADHCDPLTRTPYHKNVPVRLRAAVAPVESAGAITATTVSG